MAITYATPVKTARMNSVFALMPGGKLEIGTAAMTATGATGVLVSFTLNTPAATVSGAIMSLAGFPKTSAATATGTAATARLVDSVGASIISGLTVGLTGTDVILDNTSINNLQNVTVNATPTFTHAV